MAVSVLVVVMYVKTVLTTVAVGAVMGITRVVSVVNVDVDVTVAGMVVRTVIASAVVGVRVAVVEIVDGNPTMQLQADEIEEAGMLVRKRGAEGSAAAGTNTAVLLRSASAAKNMGSESGKLVGVWMVMVLVANTAVNSYGRVADVVTVRVTVTVTDLPIFSTRQQTGRAILRRLCLCRHGSSDGGDSR